MPKIEDTVHKYLDEGRRWYQRKLTDITKIVVHHSAAKQDGRQTNESVLRMIQGWHSAKGWPGLSYHFVIMPDGTIFQTNSFSDITWHDGTNNNSLGILVHGYFHPDVNEHPTQKQLASLKELLDWLCTENPDFPADQDDVYGHRDIMATACMPLDITEVLTDKGFINLEDVVDTDKVAQFDIDTREITFINPTRIIEPFMEKVICNKYLEQTPDHQGLRYTSKDNLIKEKWEDTTNIIQVEIPVTGKHLSPGIDLTLSEIRYLVAVQADGHYLRDNRTERVKNDKKYNTTPYEIGVQFHFKKDRKIERLTELLDQINADYYVFSIKSSGTKKITVRDKSKYNREWCEKYLDNKRFSNAFLLMNKVQADAFLEELRYWDGRSTVSYISYSSKDEENIDVVQAVCALHGYRSKSKSVSRCYEISITPNKSQWIPNNYTERHTLVGCVEVAKSNIIVRQNGFVFVTGNCPGNNLYPYVVDYREKLGQVSWDTESESECEKKLTDMTINKEEWKAKAREREKELEKKDEEIKELNEQIDRAKELCLTLEELANNKGELIAKRETEIKVLEEEIFEVRLQVESALESILRLTNEKKALQKQIQGGDFTLSDILQIIGEFINKKLSGKKVSS